MSVQDLFQQFLEKYLGVANVGNTPENIGQCVGLVEKWLVDTLKLPQVWGNAKDLLTSADKNSYDVVLNTPTNSPSLGDVPVFGASWGNGNGHTCIVISADANSMIVFEQNDPAGSAPQVKRYGYNDCLGWLHPKSLPATVTTPITDQQTAELLQAQITATSQCQTQLKTATDQITNLQQQLDDALSKQKDIQTQLNDIESKYNEDERQIIALKTEIAAIHTEDANYSQKAIDAESKLKDMTDYLSAIADELQIQGITDDKQKAEEILQVIATKLKNGEPLTDITQLQLSYYYAIIQELENHGLNNFLKFKGLPPVNINNPADTEVVSKVKAFLDEAFSELTTLNDQQKVKDSTGQPIANQAKKNLFQSLYTNFLTGVNNFIYSQK